MPQFQPPPPPPIGIAFDTAMNRIGDALAVVALYGLESHSEARIVGLAISTPSIELAAFGDSITQYYAGRPSPIGMAMDTKLPQAAPPWSTQKTSIHKLNDTADPVAVLKNGLTTLVDGHGVVMISGPATTVAHLLETRSGRETVTQKSHLLVIAAGTMSDGRPDASIAADVPALRKVLANWPTPVVFCGTEIGEALPFLGEFTSQDGPVKEAHGASTQALAAVLYAGRPKETYFKLSPSGTMSVSDDGRTKFTPSTDGKHRYLIFDPQQVENITAAYTDLTSVKPRPPFRGRGPA